MTTIKRHFKVYVNAKNCDVIGIYEMAGRFILQNPYRAETHMKKGDIVYLYAKNYASDVYDDYDIFDENGNQDHVANSEVRLIGKFTVGGNMVYRTSGDLIGIDFKTGTRTMWNPSFVAKFLGDEDTTKNGVWVTDFVPADPEDMYNSYDLGPSDIDIPNGRPTIIEPCSKREKESLNRFFVEEEYGDAALAVSSESSEYADILLDTYSESADALIDAYSESADFAAAFRNYYYGAC